MKISATLAHWKLSRISAGFRHIMPEFTYKIFITSAIRAKFLLKLDSFITYHFCKQ